MRRIYFLLVLLFVFFRPTYAQENDVMLKTITSHDTVWIGDPVQWTLQATVKPPIRIAFPIVTDSTFISGLELLQPQKNEMRTDASGSDIYRTILTFTSYDAGTYILPAFPILSIRDEEQIDTLFFNQIQIHVKTFDIDTTSFQPFDIKAPIKYPVTFADILPYIIGIWLLSGIILFIRYAIMRRLKNKPLFGKEKPTEPPHVIALRELEKIKKENLWKHTEKAKVYYTRITDILRNYIEGRYNIPAMEQTSEEMVRSLQILKLPDEIVQKLQEMLNTSDLVKFAKYTPDVDSNERNLGITQHFVEQTTPVIEDDNNKNDVEAEN